MDGSLTHSFDLTGGICERTPQLRDKLLALVRANESDNTLTCAQVGNTHLGALTGRLNLDGLSSSGHGGSRMTGLKAGDFAGLTGITSLGLGSNRLRDIPAGVFDPLTALTSLATASQRHCGGRRPDAPAGGAVRPADRADGCSSCTATTSRRCRRGSSKS